MEIDDEPKQPPNNSINSSSTLEKSESSSRSDSTGKRQIKKSNSEICDENSDSSCDESFKRKKVIFGDLGKNHCETGVMEISNFSNSKVSCDKGDCFPKDKSKFKNRNYRNSKRTIVEKESSDEEVTDEQVYINVKKDKFHSYCLIN